MASDLGDSTGKGFGGLLLDGGGVLGLELEDGFCGGESGGVEGGEGGEGVFAVVVIGGGVEGGRGRGRGRRVLAEVVERGEEGF